MVEKLTPARVAAARGIFRLLRMVAAREAFAQTKYWNALPY
jgi:hypothetical protein